MSFDLVSPTLTKSKLAGRGAAAARNSSSEASIAAALGDARDRVGVGAEADPDLARARDRRDAQRVAVGGLGDREQVLDRAARRPASAAPGPGTLEIERLNSRGLTGEVLGRAVEVR